MQINSNRYTKVTADIVRVIEYHYDYELINNTQKGKGT